MNKHVGQIMSKAVGVSRDLYVNQACCLDKMCATTEKVLCYLKRTHNTQTQENVFQTKKVCGLNLKKVKNEGSEAIIKVDLNQVCK